ncbi:squalene--hopene cyclase [Pseudofrankia sp. DC12]|uniref:squalene--hopene cyclase n=1 Tax=Pseudofrankia sp. DC12 TaxID=683315 RepID=UPI000695C5F3|nr:squalene--hopene cyclase [Pseudofrankia sp. DC12]
MSLTSDPSPATPATQPTSARPGSLSDRRSRSERSAVAGPVLVTTRPVTPVAMSGPATSVAMSGPATSVAMSGPGARPGGPALLPDRAADLTDPTGPMARAAGAAGTRAPQTGQLATTELPGTQAAERAAAALGRARDHLLGLQSEDGWWKGELETNVTMDAEDLMLRQFLGILSPELAAETGRWIRSKQQTDGGWPTFHGGPSDLSTTFEAYVGLRLAGDAPDAPHMLLAASFVRAHGGLAATRVFTRIWMALFGEWPWDEVPVLPPELVLLPSWVPLNVYDFGCWARQTVVALTIVGHFRPVRSLGFTIDELRVAAVRPDRAPLVSWTGVFQRLDAGLRRYQRHPVKTLRELALRRATEWVLARQEADGGWGGIQPPWVYSIMALHLMGYSMGHPVLVAALDGLETFTVREQVRDGDEVVTVRRLEACQSPVWDTALAVVALADAGLDARHPGMRKAGEWLVREEVTVPGDWRVRRPNLEPGGWAFEFANDIYPDVDDTAEVVLAVRRLLGSGWDDVDPAFAKQARAAVERAVNWSVGMRSANGAWGAFDADNVRELATKIPFCDFGEVIDPPSADVTAHMVEMLADLGRADHPVTQRAVRWLLDDQEPGGSWFGRWGVNHVYGTGAAVPALISAGVAADHPAIRSAVRWLVAHQHPDGGWGEDLRSYKDDAWVGRGEPTASQTAWALLALLAADPMNEAVGRGVRWLCDTQLPDGSWDEPYYTGTGFPWDFSINYHLYRLVFPLTALGRYVTLTGRSAA